MAPPLGDVAHLGHVELLTPDLDSSVRFFTEILGLTENGRSGDSVYLRTWDDYEHHSLTLTAHSTSGMRRTALRASSEEALQRRVKETENAGLPGRWVDDEPGIGPLYLTRDPDGHEVALYWESEWYEAPPELAPGWRHPARTHVGRMTDRRTPAREPTHVVGPSEGQPEGRPGEGRGRPEVRLEGRSATSRSAHLVSDASESTACRTCCAIRA
jgi:catechol 2,3-dioxygenase-like lactoylglutathione lyase family enzyme